MDVFDIIGPVMIGPSSSHTAGAARIGRIARALLGERPVRPDRAARQFCQDIQGTRNRPSLAGSILGMEPDDERIRDSLSIARREGLDVRFFPRAPGRRAPQHGTRDPEGGAAARSRFRGASVVAAASTSHR